ncbi:MULTISPECIES: rhomboid family intramembrane serine protease [Streptomyces]|uniref:Rhomboid family intramembrane serine protease n=1 Tax=Streptomyces amritsarensis TaxID=681158 RepID=A0ABX3G4N0_9ACTN|nr:MULTISPECIES: rhomboid family intramembrane serine protease [Streptomyces]AQT73824.1 rhomboid family intramembrane serine protease [Streptomyces sp. fd1-xmd]OLZ69082.1 rhomboid family intramembrane serine protease [Streptomyces amritsarensis]
MSTTVDTGWTQTDRAKAAAKLMLGWVALLWLLEAVDHATGHALDQYGIVARDPDSLGGIVSAAFLHFGFDHVASNSVPLLVLGFIAALSGIRRFLAVCGLILLADGLGTWLISPSGTMTLGASGIVFGLFGYLLVRGFVERRALGIAVAVGVAAVWGTTIVSGILPTDSGVSWQGHLCGLVAGIVTALYFRRPARRPAVTA